MCKDGKLRRRMGPGHSRMINEVVDIAGIALSSKNVTGFNLAAEIFQRNLEESGPSVDSYLGLGDAYAATGDLKKAFLIYSKAYQIGNIEPEKLNNLVTALVNNMCAKNAIEAPNNEKQIQQNVLDSDIFACGLCHLLLLDPVTITCGHTFCRECLENLDRGPTRACKKCGKHQSKSFSDKDYWKTNVLLSDVIELCFKEELEAMKIKSKANEYFMEEKYQSAIEKYTECLICVPENEQIISNRSCAYAKLEMFDLALRDAEHAIYLKPYWHKGYYRKGIALNGLHRYDEAAFAFLQCSSIDPSLTSARIATAKALHKVLSPVHPHELSEIERQQYLPQHSLPNIPSLSLVKLGQLSSNMGIHTHTSTSSPSGSYTKTGMSHSDDSCTTTLSGIDAQGSSSSDMATSVQSLMNSQESLSGNMDTSGQSLVDSQESLSGNMETSAQTDSQERLSEKMDTSGRHLPDSQECLSGNMNSSPQSLFDSQESLSMLSGNMEISGQPSLDTSSQESLSGIMDTTSCQTSDSNMCTMQEESKDVAMDASPSQSTYQPQPVKRQISSSPEVPRKCIKEVTLTGYHGNSDGHPSSCQSTSDNSPPIPSDSSILLSKLLQKFVSGNENQVLPPTGIGSSPFSKMVPHCDNSQIPGAMAPPSKPDSPNDDKRHIPQDRLSVENFECSLCFRLFYQPVTTDCGHMFCMQCLYRCLDHNSYCPLCKTSLSEYLAERRTAVTEVVEIISKKYFPDLYTERDNIHKDELEELKKSANEIPIFVCTLAYPTVPCPLHVFEPRYRLMIRQCVESGTRQFGMCTCLDENEDNFAEYGSMLEIRNLEYFPDGRAVVDAVGGRRFHVLSRGVKDGYHTAKVEFLQDKPAEPEELQEVRELHNEVHKEGQLWFQALAQFTRGRILQHFGNFPELEENAQILSNGAAWAWWMTAVLPLDPRAQLAMLAITSFKERLLALRRLVQHARRRQNRE